MARKQLAVLALVVLGCLAATPADAQSAGDIFRPYLSLYGGASIPEHVESKGALTAEPPSTVARSRHDVGFLVGATLGVAVRAWLPARVEIDLSYRRHQLDDLRVARDGGVGDVLGLGPLDGLSASGLGLDLEGRTNVFAALANYWVDIPTGTALTPYLGGGLGLARVTARSVQLEGVPLVDDHDTVFAWQLGTGLDLALTPNWSLSAGYRWFNTADAELEFTPTGRTFSSKLRSHSILGGIRFNF